MYLNVTYMYLYVYLSVVFPPRVWNFFFFLFLLISATITTLYISATITSIFRNELQIIKRKANRKRVTLLLLLLSVHSSYALKTFKKGSILVRKAPIVSFMSNLSFKKFPCKLFLLVSVISFG